MTDPPMPETAWTAEEFIRTDQHVFGDAWRYELVDGRILSHPAQAPEHGAIVAGLAGAVARRLAGTPGGCRPELGSAATPKTRQRNTARIPDVMIRCGQHPVAMFEVVSPSEIRDWRARDLKRSHLQGVEGCQIIVELFQDDHAAHVYRRGEAGSWLFEALGGQDAVLRLDHPAISLTLSEIYAFAELPG